jgi:hypothetical protein
LQVAFALVVSSSACTTTHQILKNDDNDYFATVTTHLSPPIAGYTARPFSHCSFSISPTLPICLGRSSLKDYDLKKELLTATIGIAELIMLSSLPL